MIKQIIATLMPKNTEAFNINDFILALYDASIFGMQSKDPSGDYRVRMANGEYIKSIKVVEELLTDGSTVTTIYIIPSE